MTCTAQAVMFCTCAYCGSLRNGLVDRSCVSCGAGAAKEYEGIKYDGPVYGEARK